jgi:hypothetical protein
VRERLDTSWLEEVASLATVVWRLPAGRESSDSVGADEHVWTS